MLALKALLSCWFMVSGLVGLQLFLKTRNFVYYFMFCILEQKNLPQQVVACLLVFFSFCFPPFWVTSCWQMLCLEGNDPAIIPQNIEFRVNYRLSLHHQCHWRSWKHHIYISKQNHFDWAAVFPQCWGGVPIKCFAHFGHAGTVPKANLNFLQVNTA